MKSLISERHAVHQTQGDIGPWPICLLYESMAERSSFRQAVILIKASKTRNVSAAGPHDHQMCNSETTSGLKVPRKCQPPNPQVSVLTCIYLKERLYELKRRHSCHTVSTT